MNQKILDPAAEEEKKNQGWYQKQMEKTRTTFAGFTYEFAEKNTFDDSKEEREEFFRTLWAEGGFNFWLANYKDSLYNIEANHEAYVFWRKQVLQRLSDSAKQELLAPMIPPHPWGTKRPSLEQRFYEVVDQPHVNFVDVNKSPIEEVTAMGIKTKREALREVDVIILATGFDAVTGSLSQLDIRSTNGGTVADHWKYGTRTSMGIAMSGFHSLREVVQGPCPLSKSVNQQDVALVVT